MILGTTFMETVHTRTYLGMVLYGSALTDDAVRPMASLALFSSFSNILFIPPSKKYSWQTLWKWNQNITVNLTVTCHKSTSHRFRWVKPHCDEVQNCSWKTVEDIWSRTCDTSRYGPLLRIFSSSGCQQDSSWQGHTHSASAHLHSAHARSCQSRPLWKKKICKMRAELTNKNK